MEPLSTSQIILYVLYQFTPVWILLFLTFALSMRYRMRLGLYGAIFNSPVGMIGLGLVLFWCYTALVYSLFDGIITYDPLKSISGMKNKLPGTAVRGASLEDYQWYLLGGDKLARDLFSQMVAGSAIVIAIAPLATIFAFMIGITLGLPAGYFGKKLDMVLSFIANLILGFPVILIFYLIVTPEIQKAGLPAYMAAILFIFPIFFAFVLINSRFHTQKLKRNILVGTIVGSLVFLYVTLISQSDRNTYVDFLPKSLDAFDIDKNMLIVFVSVVFVNSPTVFRIVRGLALDVKTRDYVAAAQTRGENSWYIMLWEILPNARGPLIVDFCLRIGYTTILLGTLGFFGLGLEPTSPDWGTTINSGRKLLQVYPHAAAVPAIALLSLVLGLNLLADGLREESLKN